MKVRITRTVTERVVVDAPDDSNSLDWDPLDYDQPTLYDQVVNDVNWIADSEVTSVCYERVSDDEL